MNSKCDNLKTKTKKKRKETNAFHYKRDRKKNKIQFEKRETIYCDFERQILIQFISSIETVRIALVFESVTWTLPDK